MKTILTNLSTILVFSVVSISCKDQARDDTSVQTTPNKGGESPVKDKVVDGQATNNKDQNAITENLDAALLEQGMNYASLYTERDYDKRIAQVEEYENYNQEALVYVREGKAMKEDEDTLKKEIQNSSVNLNFLKKLVSSASNTQHFITIRNCDTELTQTIIAILKLLKNDDGKWAVGSGGIVFDNIDSSLTFSNHIRRIQKMHLKQAEAQVHLLTNK